ncbi:zinc finger MYND domain-containing protein 12 [Sceloporus undulatus]|uniref:zinc finger MYND domain-containing protein 12 n=1 Tax=Sceloporus undulatus TaxID=8520 RepID=UPI001C4CA518|nr:zinc finger MYND domain-containing protein 12 [Sceloporus undulatus]
MARARCDAPEVPRRRGPSNGVPSNRRPEPARRMQTERVEPLSLPRGRRLFCELCLGPATVRCGACGVTYYCEVEHQSADWISVHEKICQLLLPLRTASPFYNSVKERKHGQEQKISRERFLAEFTYTIAQNYLFEGKHEEAIPASLHSLKFSISVYGSDSVELVPAYLILAEASLGLGHVSQGEEYLSQALWIVLKNPNCNSAIQSKLHRNMGLLHAARGNFDDSLYHLANDIYFASCAFGTNNVATSGGYFHMANVFLRKNVVDVANSLYAEVVDIWHKHFSHLIDLRYQAMTTPAQLDIFATEEQEPAEKTLDEQEQSEATQMLNAILEIEEQSSKPQLARIVKVVHALAMLHYLILDLPKAQELVARVQRMMKQLPKAAPNESLRHLVKLLKAKPIYAK